MLTLLASADIPIWFIVIGIIFAVLIVGILVAIIVLSILTRKQSKNSSTDSIQVEVSHQQNTINSKPVYSIAQNSYNEQDYQAVQKARKSLAERAYDTQSQNNILLDNQSTQSAMTSQSYDDMKNMIFRVSRRKEDGRWQVNANNNVRPIRVFVARDDAIEFAKLLATKVRNSNLA